MNYDVTNLRLCRHQVNFGSAGVASLTACRKRRDWTLNLGSAKRCGSVTHRRAIEVHARAAAQSPEVSESTWLMAPTTAPKVEIPPAIPDILVCNAFKPAFVVSICVRIV